ncbi:hypothetical protein PF007_g25432 [Phytophthora fragariae]|uniref:Uncharacterized protein n=1 Tax=Phytophthora fragariae TaxID=53985 RepID=A0A6A3QEK3_9STRA|nr:hypothetical protein PF007_g25432 [Phytophthora fragariae]
MSCSHHKNNVEILTSAWKRCSQHQREPVIMVRLVHSAVQWSARCILGSSSEDENVPPNVQRGGAQAPAESAKSSSPGSTSSTGTTTPPWMSPQHGLRVPKEVSNPPPYEGLDGWRHGDHAAHD